MKKKYLFLFSLSFLLVCSSFAQNNSGKADDEARISITPQVSDQEIPASAKKMLINKMKQIATKNGMAGDGDNPFFIMDASIDVLSKEITPTAPPMHALSMQINFTIKGADGNVYSETSYSTKGVSKNETKAYIAGLKNINTSRGQFKAFVEKGKEKIVEYYNSECDFVISKAKAMQKQGRNDAAIKVLESVPTVCKECYDMCMEVMSEIKPSVEVNSNEPCKAELVLSGENGKNGLIGSYYKGISINASGNIKTTGLEKVFERVDSDIDFWNGAKGYSWSPIKDRSDEYTVIWNGYINIDTEGQYGFGTISDDGSEVWIDDKLVVANAELQWYDWEDNISEGTSGTEIFPPLNLSVGYHKISVKYYEQNSFDGIKLFWLKPGSGKSIKPYDGESFNGTYPVYNKNTNWEIVPNSVLFIKNK